MLEACRTTPNEELLKEICSLLEPYPDAAEFVLRYRDYIHGVDDIVDGDITNAEDILKVTALASEIFSSDFYVNHRQFLYPLEIMINNTYADAVEWERSNVEWKERDAMVLRHTGIDMFLFVIRLMCGREAMRKISSKFREQCHEYHMTKDYKPL